MDCRKLNSDIKQLKSLRDELRGKVGEATETGKGKIEISRTSSKLTDATDSTLERYFQDFAEHNPEIFELQFGDRIDGFKDQDGYLQDIKSISALPDGSALIGGTNGTLYHATRDENGKFKLGGLIDGFKDRDGLYRFISSISALPDGSALVGGDNDTLYHATRDENGEFKFGDLIDGFGDRDGYLQDIQSISALPDGSALIGGDNGTLYHAAKPPVNLDTLKQNLDKIAAKRELNL